MLMPAKDDTPKESVERGRLFKRDKIRLVIKNFKPEITVLACVSNHCSLRMQECTEINLIPEATNVFHFKNNRLNA